MVFLYHFCFEIRLRSLLYRWQVGMYYQRTIRLKLSPWCSVRPLLRISLWVGENVKRFLSKFFSLCENSTSQVYLNTESDKCDKKIFANNFRRHIEKLWILMKNYTFLLKLGRLFKKMFSGKHHVKRIPSWEIFPRSPPPPPQDRRYHKFSYSNNYSIWKMYDGKCGTRFTINRSN